MRDVQAEAGASLNSLTAVPDEAVGPARRGVSRAPIVLGVAVLVYLLDRATKSWALANLVENEPRDFLGSVLRLRLIFNPGAAFSLGTGATPLFTVVMAAVSVGVLYAALRVRSWPWTVALGLVLGGATGNLTDRLIQPPGFARGHVVDFLELPHWPIFNIADSAIVTAAVLVALLSLRNVPFGDPGPEDSTRPRDPAGSDGSAGPDRPGPDEEAHGQPHGRAHG